MEGQDTSGDGATAPANTRHIGLPPRPQPRQRRSRLAGLAGSSGPTPFVPDGETVHVDRRKHPAALAVPLLRSLAGVVALTSGLALPAVLVFAALTALWARVRARAGRRGALLAAAAATVVLLWMGSASPLSWSLAIVLLWLWAIEDAAAWWHDRLVVTDKRVYRRYGWLTQHAPSMALANAVFVDVSVNPVDRLLRCGTLSFDSAAQRDDPLARLSLVPDVADVHHTVLRLRSSAYRPVG